MSEGAVFLTGGQNPDPAFEQPFEQLASSHDGMRHSLEQLRRLLAHLDTIGHDTAARSTARAVWRYFEIAAPAHHVDEELHVLPRLRQDGDAHLEDLARRIEADHDALRAVWHRLGPLLRQVHQSSASPSTESLDALVANAAAFIAIHERHFRLEDGVAFRAAQERMRPDELHAMGREIQNRRTTAA